MDERKKTGTDNIPSWKEKVNFTKEDFLTMTKIRSIVDRGNNAEVKRRSGGELVVIEVKKKIV